MWNQFHMCALIISNNSSNNRGNNSVYILQYQMTFCIIVKINKVSDLSNLKWASDHFGMFPHCFHLPLPDCHQQQGKVQRNIDHMLWSHFSIHRQLPLYHTERRGYGLEGSLKVISRKEDLIHRHIFSMHKCKFMKICIFIAIKNIVQELQHSPAGKWMSCYSFLY